MSRSYHLGVDDGEQCRPGWYRVVASAALGPGEVMASVVPDRRTGGQAGVGTPALHEPDGPGGPWNEVAVWRTMGGEVCVVDARCPHQWSHLAAEGVVDGDELVCTSHFWRFDRTGRGCKLAMNGRRDPKADVEVLVCEERDGGIWVQI